MKSIVNGQCPLTQSRFRKQMLILNGGLYILPARVLLLPFKEMTKAHGAKKNVTSWILKKNKVQVAKLTPVRKPITLQELLRPILIIGQAFGLIPVIGLYRKKETNLSTVASKQVIFSGLSLSFLYESRQPSKIKKQERIFIGRLHEEMVKALGFHWISWRCLYSTILLVGQICMCIMCFNKMFRVETTLQSTSQVIFYGTTCITVVMFLQVSSKWPKLVKHAVQTEDLDPDYNSRLTFKCYTTCATVLFLAILEHIFSLVYAFSEAMECYAHTSIYEGFVRVSYPWVYNFIPYSTPLGIITQFLHFQATFIWNFSDLFVICLSYYLTSRLDNVNQRLLIAQGKYLPTSYWRGAREDYCRVTQLVREVDQVISGIIFVSFANNLFFVCLQLFNTLENGIKGTAACRSSRLKGTNLFGGYEAPTYFIFSLVYLISRYIAVSLIASQVHSASLLPAPVLYDVPSPVYCIEVQRFIDQVNGDNVALSGLQFFSVKRELLLTVAGTIVTYELVMLQLTPPAQSTTTIPPNITIP